MPLSRLNLAATALRSAWVPETSVYFVSPLARARIAASLMFCGVSKSGSPCDRLITFLPSAIMRRATVEIAMVRLGWIRSRRSAVRDMTDSRLYGEARETIQAMPPGQPFGQSLVAGLRCIGGAAPACPSRLAAADCGRIAQREENHDPRTADLRMRARA